MIELLRPSERAPSQHPKPRGELASGSVEQSRTPFKAHLDMAIDHDDPTNSLQQGVSSEARDQAVKAAQDLVSVALVQPVLKHMRESNKATPPFGPGKGERMFRSMMDASIAQGLVGSGRWELVDAVARKLLSKTTPAGVGGAYPVATEQDAQVTKVQTP